MKCWENHVVAAAALLVLCSSNSVLMAGKKKPYRAVFPLPPGVTAARSSVFGLNESGNLLGWYESGR